MSNKLIKINNQPLTEFFTFRTTEWLKKSLEKEAKSRNVSVNQILNDLVTDRYPKPSKSKQ